MGSDLERSFGRLLYIQDQGLQQELEADNQRQHSQHDRAGRREDPLPGAPDPVVGAEIDSEGCERNVAEQEERDRVKIRDEVAPPDALTPVAQALPGEFKQGAADLEVAALVPVSGGMRRSSTTAPMVPSWTSIELSKK